MKRATWAVSGAVASLVAVGAVSASPLAITSPQVTSALSGEVKGEALTGQVAVQVENSKSALVRITNTTPVNGKSTPVITRLGFTLDSVPNNSCLQLEDPSGRFTLTTKVTPFCGLGGGKKKNCGWGIFSKWGKWAKKPAYAQAADAFTHALEAKAPSPKNGVTSGNSLVVRLKVKPGCNYNFTTAAFTDSLGVGPQDVQWAAKFQSVGKKGQDSGCGFGGGEEVVVEPETCKPVYTWSEFIATSSDLNKLPSLLQAPDSRGGSVEYNFNGGYGFNGISNEAPYEAAILSMRNGQPKILEQWQFNRTNTPAVLDANNCSIGSAFPQCWIFDPGDTVDNVLGASVPTNSTGSNQDFDNSGLRVEISGGIEIEYTETLFDDNGHQRMLVEWHAPLGLETAQLLLRGRYDWNLNFLDAADYFVPLFHRNIAALGPDSSHESIDIIEETATTLRLVVDVQGATVAVCEDYLDAGLITLTNGPK